MKTLLRTKRIQSGLYQTLDGRFSIVRRRSPFGLKIWQTIEHGCHRDYVLFTHCKLHNARIELAYELILRRIESETPREI